MFTSLAKERLNSLSSDREGGPRHKIQVEKKKNPQDLAACILILKGI